MSLRATLESGVATAFNLVGDLKRTITIREQTAGSYNEVTGGVVRTTTDHTLEAAVISPTAKELQDPAVRATDLIAYYDPNDAPTLAEPQVNTSVLIGADEYTVFRARAIGPTDQGAALLWKLTLRRPSAEAA